MNELKTTNGANVTPPKMEGVSNEVAALGGLLHIVNNLTADPTKRRVAEAAVIPPAAPGLVVVPDLPTPGAKVNPEWEKLGPEANMKFPTPADFAPININPLPKLAPGTGLFFTGRICAGKDYCATQAGCRVLGFADPLYWLANHFFGIHVDANTGKDIPGIRKFLQTTGQWGRGTVTAEYPLTAERALFVTMIRSLAASGVIAYPHVEWKTFGSNENIWLDAALTHALGISNAALTNVRFENEFKALKERGWQHWHVMTSAKSWGERIAKRGLTPQSAAVSDISEKLAAGLDAKVTQKLSAQKNGPKLHVIWNDNTPPPSARLYTVAEFLQEVKQ